jgi:hypothetical protein
MGFDMRVSLVGVPLDRTNGNDVAASSTLTIHGREQDTAHLSDHGGNPTIPTPRRR